MKFEMMKDNCVFYTQHKSKISPIWVAESGLFAEPLMSEPLICGIFIAVTDFREILKLKNET